MLNYGVLKRLEHAYKKKHSLDEYAEENKDYPEDLVNPPVRIINRERKKRAWELNNKRQ